MTVTASGAMTGIPLDVSPYVTVDASGTALIVNPGDLVIFSGLHAIARSGNLAAFKASAVGIALDRNPARDWAGREVVNSALVVARWGNFRVSASFSGNPLRGVLAVPDTTGSGVNAASGVTGVGATWTTSLPVSVSGGTAATPAVLAIAQVWGWNDSGPAGTGQLDVWMWPRNADIY